MWFGCMIGGVDCGDYLVLFDLVVDFYVDV